MSQRAYQTNLDGSGAGTVEISVPQTAMEWAIYQISPYTQSSQAAAPYCQARILHNGFLLCSTAQGTADTATGPPWCILKPNDVLTVQWIYGVAHDLATVSFFYDENPVGTSRIGTR